MMMLRCLCIVLLLSLSVLVDAGGSISEKKSVAAVGPIQKVLELLDSLKAKIIAEGEVEGEQFAEYTKWCAEETDTKEDAIKWGTDRVATLNANIEQLTGEVSNLAAEINTVAGQISVNEKDLKAAQEIRAKERADFEAGDKEMSDTVDMLVRAKSVLKKQLNLGLAQTGKGAAAKSTTSAAVKDELRLVVQGISTILDAAFVDAEDRKKLQAFVQSTQGTDEDDEDLQPSGAPAPEAYKSHSSGILDVLGELQDKAEEEQAELRKKEMNAKHAFEMLEQSITDELDHSKSHLDDLKASSATKREAMGANEGDLAVASKTLKEDKAYFQNLAMMCQQKSAEWETRQKSRAEELKALEEAKQILSGEGMQGATERHMGMIQIAQHSKTEDDNRQEAAEYLDRQAEKLHSVALSQLATRFRDGDDPFAKVKGMIQEMIERLVNEAAEEASHKAWCDEETSESKKSREKHQGRVDVLSGRMAKAEASVAKLTQDVASLQKEVAQMNKGEAEATEQRNKEKTEYEANIKDYAEAGEALTKAIAVLQEMYGGAALVQTGKEDPKFGGPIASGPYKKQDGSGIIGMLEVAQSDFAKMDTEAKADEAEAKREYEQLVQDNAVSRATKEADIKGKTAEKGRLESNLEEMTDDRKASQKELDAVLEYLEKLKEACEVKPESYEERKARRRAEIDSLREALEILEGVGGEGGASAFLQVRKHATQRA